MTIEQRFEELISVYRKSPIVKQMDNYIQHGDTTTLTHCENVAWVSFLINKKFHLNADEKELIEAAMLHDLYLYDWHIKNEPRKLHGFSHAEIACKNAVKYFDIPESAQKAIKSHMWPLNITKIPSSRVAIIICIADKYCAVAETVNFRRIARLKNSRLSNRQNS